MQQPCYTPVTTGNLSVISPSSITAHVNPSYSAFTSPIQLVWDHVRFNDSPQAVSIHRVKHRLKDDEIKIHGCIPLVDLVQDIT